MSKACKNYDYESALSICEKLKYNFAKHLEIDRNEGSKYEFGHETLEEIFAFFKMLVDFNFEKITKSELIDRFSQLRERHGLLEDRFPMYAGRFKFDMYANRMAVSFK